HRTASAHLGELGRLGQWQCDYTLGRPTPDIVPDGILDSSPEATAIRIRLRHIVNHQDEPGDVAFLHQCWESEPTSWGRALAAGTESCLLQSSDTKKADDMALEAVRAEPKNSDGQWCNPWEQLLTLADVKPNAISSARAMQAWMPWNDISWFAQGHADQTPT